MPFNALLRRRVAEWSRLGKRRDREPFAHDPLGGILPILRLGPRSYTHTVLIDLAISEAEVLAAFGSTCGRHLRAPAKRGLRAEPITDERFVNRLAALDAETMTRSGGQVRPIDWPGMLNFVRNEPTHAKLIGISRPDCADESALLGFVLGGELTYAPSAILDRVARSASRFVTAVRARKR